MMKALPVFADPDLRSIQRAVAGLRQEIALAQNKRVALDAAIDSRQKKLARLEASLVLSGSPARSALEMIARR